MTENEERMLAAIAWMCCQYMEEDGVVDHMWMSAGENATAILVEYGLLEMEGRGGTWTEAGKAFLASH
ncbi:MAG: hypothetical protein ABI471_10380 [Sphingomonas bacterium]